MATGRFYFEYYDIYESRNSIKEKNAPSIAGKKSHSLRNLFSK
jgi:hypothetical protein